MTIKDMDNHPLMVFAQECVLGVYRKSEVADAAQLAIKYALEAKDEPVAQGSIQHLKIMMEESAWEGRIELSDVLANIDEFYTTPPQRKPLTDEEIKEAVLDDTFGGLAILSMMREEIMIADVRQAINRIARAIEAAHGIKEKNT
jgi:hypothetical protein